MNTSSEWSGDMLKQPEVVEAFTTQVRHAVNDILIPLSNVRREAEAMWRANPPDGYNSVEAWWHNSRLTSRFAALQEALEKAAALTFELEHDYRERRHERPAAKEAVKSAKTAQRGQPLPGRTPSGRLHQGDGQAAHRPPSRSHRPGQTPPGERTFISLLNDEERRNRRSA